jgi:diguanylate cyclase (GGDEF)-like protein
MRIRPLDNSRATSASSEAKRTSGTASADSSAAAAGPRDAASIMGVPENELTPNVQRALLTLMGEVDQLRQETERLRSKITDLESLADHDVLLPILNRRAFVREVSKAVALAERHNAPSALAYFDLNGFKAVNDTYGHAAGDAALHHVSAMLTTHLRETDAIGRLGGDEFGVVLTLSSLPAAEQKAEELVKLISETPFEHDGQSLTINAAYGVRPLDAGMTPDTAMAEADAAMYARKEATKRAAV